MVGRPSRCRLIPSLPKTRRSLTAVFGTVVSRGWLYYCATFQQRAELPGAQTRQRRVNWIPLLVKTVARCPSAGHLPPISYGPAIAGMEDNTEATARVATVMRRSMVSPLQRLR